MITSTWVKDEYLDQRFNEERIKASNLDHPMSLNYSTWFNPNEIIAYTMSWDSNKIYMCSTIGRKDFWPVGVYRVLNRLFKGEPVSLVTKYVNPYWVEQVEEQVNFLKKLPDFRTAIISRKQGYRRSLTVLNDALTANGTGFTLYESPIWVCDDCHNTECLQDVLYYGENSLNEFKTF